MEGVAALPRSGRRPKRSRPTAKKLVQMVRRNPGTTEEPPWNQKLLEHQGHGLQSSELYITMRLRSLKHLNKKNVNTFVQNENEQQSENHRDRV